jgi:hypothetical protein
MYAHETTGFASQTPASLVPEGVAIARSHNPRSLTVMVGFSSLSFSARLLSAFSSFCLAVPPFGMRSRAAIHTHGHNRATRASLLGISLCLWKHFRVSLCQSLWRLTFGVLGSPGLNFRSLNIPYPFLTRIVFPDTDPCGRSLDHVRWRLGSSFARASPQNGSI